MRGKPSLGFLLMSVLCILSFALLSSTKLCSKKIKDIGQHLTAQFLETIKLGPRVVFLYCGLKLSESGGSLLGSSAPPLCHCIPLAPA